MTAIRPQAKGRWLAPMVASGRLCHCCWEDFGPPVGPVPIGGVPVNETAAMPDCARDRHLFGPGPKRILSLDGGGVRGALSIGILEQLEKHIKEIAGPETRLCDWFDLIGGTSTG